MTFLGRYIDPLMRDSSFIINLFCVCVCEFVVVCVCVHVGTFTCVCLEVGHIL